MQRTFKLYEKPAKEDIRLQWNDHAKYNTVCSKTGMSIDRGDPIYYDKVAKKVYLSKDCWEEANGIRNY